MPEPQANETEEQFVERCIPIVLEDGAAEGGEQAAAICHSMWREAQEEKAAHAIKLIDESPDGFIVGGYGHVWGDPQHKDLYGDYFTPESDLMPDLVPVKLALFDHTMTTTPDGTRFDHPVGKALERWSRADSIGKWIQAILDKRAKYVDKVMELVERGILAWSSGSVPHLVKRAANGFLSRWPVIEYTLTPTPAEPRMTDINRLKAAYKAAGLDLLVEEQVENAEGQNAKAETDKALKLARAKLQLLKLR